MASSEHTNDYVLGRGEVYVDVWVNDAPTGIERFLGNAPSFNLTQAVQKIEHFASTQGLRVKDASAVLEINMTGKLVVDDVSAANLGLWFSGSAATENQTATGGGSPITETLTAAKGRYYQLGLSDAMGSLRNLTNFTIARENSAFNTVTAVTAASAGAGLTNGTRVFTLTDGTGTQVASFSFVVSGGAITGAATIISGGRYSVNPDLTANATATVDSGILGGATFDLTMGALADATLSTDQYEFTSATGRVYLAEAADEFDDGDTINVSYKKLGATRETVTATGEPVTASLRFLSANASGSDRHYFLKKVELTSDGDFSTIGQEWQQMSFNVEALQFSTGAARCLIDGKPLLT